ncbi:radical SAM protein [Calditrichota bacterium]
MIIEIQAKSILRRHKKIDSWFMSHYGLNLYRGCSHDCTYCDGRAETYRVEGEFGKDIEVKTNAIEILDREMNPARKRKPMPRSFMLLGGGVCDAYQPVEKKYQLARQTLELILKYNFPVHILTKSALVERDLDLLQKINNQNKAIVSFSFSSADDKISKIFEPGVPSPSERFNLIKKIKDTGMSCGMFLMPVIPFLTDTPEKIEETLQSAKEAGIDFVIFGNMTLKIGRQKEHFFRILQKHYPELIPKYEQLYCNRDQWGAPISKYITSIHQIFEQKALVLKIPIRMSFEIYQKFLNQNDMIIVILEHMDYILKLRNQKSPYGYAAYSLSKLQKPIANIPKEKLLKMKGMGPVTVKIINEIIENGRCKYYENLMQY